MEQQGQTPKPEEYKAMAAWLYWQAFSGSYIEAQQERAARDGAPTDALSPRWAGDGWVCVSDLEEQDRGQIEKLLAEFGPRGHTPWKGATNGR